MVQMHWEKEKEPHAMREPTRYVALPKHPARNFRERVTPGRPSHGAITAT